MPEMFGLPATEAQPEQAKPEMAIATVAKGVIERTDRGLQLRTLDDTWRFAQYIVKSGLAPSSFKTAEQVIVAIQYGAEVGFSPMQALQSIAVINGKPSMYGDAIPALILGSGLCDGTPKEWLEGEGDKMAAHCEAKRKDSDDPVKRSFSVDDAKKAGLWGKAGPWTQYPKRMLQMRARAFCLRDAFADVLRGMQVREEVEDYSRTEHSGPENYSLPLSDD